MTMTLEIPTGAVERMLGSLLGRDISVAVAPELELYSPSIAGLVNTDNELVGALGADFEFVAASGAALALMPPVPVEDVSDDDRSDLIEFYGEVANVLSRLVNDHGLERVRIDPGIEHPIEHLGLIVGAAERTLFQAEISGYGVGTVALFT